MFSVGTLTSTAPTTLTSAILTSSLNSLPLNALSFSTRMQLKNLKLDERFSIAERNSTLALLVPSISSTVSFNSNLITATEELKSEGNDEYLIILPFIVLFGLCGNTISLIAIFHSRLRKVNI